MDANIEALIQAASEAAGMVECNCSGNCDRSCTHAGILDAIEAIRKNEAEQQGEEAKYFRELARKQAKEGELEVDPDAIVSRGDDPGAYVQVWLWIPDERKKFLVRKNCEYAIQVHATTEDEAMEKADSKPLNDWGASWSDTEVDEDAKA